MRANRAYRLIVTRGGWVPAPLADPRRTDSIEIVHIDSGEVVLFWDCSPVEASQLARAIRTDLAQLDADTFFERWSADDDGDPATVG